MAQCAGPPGRRARILFETNLRQPLTEQPGGLTRYRCACSLRIDGATVSLVREVGTQRSFLPPREVMGLRIWLDACDDAFEFLTDTHGGCRPRKKVRLALQDASRRICPVLLHPWCPLPEGGLRIEDCYNGDDCWMGAYRGASAHGGLDINLLAPEHTPLPAGLHLAEAAGVYVGDHEHSHFVFKVREPGAAEGEEILLDPWILFWQMYADRRRAIGLR